MALKPWEFEKLQPQEFMLLVDGYEWRNEQKENLLAFFVSGLMNVEGKCLKSPISPQELLAPIRRNKDERDKKNEEEYLRETFGLE